MDRKEKNLEEYIEAGKLPLTGEIFHRREEVSRNLTVHRAEERVRTPDTTLRSVKRRGLVHIRPFYYRVAAASIVLLMGMGGYLLSEEKVVTDETAMEYQLPDGSLVELMENSSLSYNRMGWLWQRKLNLLGKAFFSVKHGRTFTVKTEAGSITVLGTRFLVHQEGKRLLVDCEEGSVKVLTPVGQQTLAAGQSVHCDERKIETIEEVKPSEDLPEVLGYEEDPLVNVVADIEQIFGYRIMGREKCEGLVYNGVIHTRNLNTTLQDVFLASGINYRVRGKEIILQ